MGRRQRDTALIALSDEEIRRGARDKSLPATVRRRYQTEEKYRRRRNVAKRKGRDRL